MMKKLLFLFGIIITTFLPTQAQQTMYGSYAMTGTLTVDQINEWTSGAGLTAEGVLLKDAGISLTSGGIDINTVGQAIQFGDLDTRIFEQSDDALLIQTLNTTRLQINTAGIQTFLPLFPNSSLSDDIGTSTKFYNDTYIGHIYL